MQRDSLDSAIDTNARPQWSRTGYKFFPYAAQQSDQWWVLRVNVGFPEHDLYTLFIDSVPAVDITGDPTNPLPLASSVGSLSPFPPAMDEPILDPATAHRVVKPVAQYVNYGSEWNDPCVFCSDERDGMARVHTSDNEGE
ncbi:hypothetical protein ABW16_13570 [Mycolicibacter heraklionensis]|uniref:Uncharacterized protein n=1 Tax=Mycolicibacter heraklionensis TaxID=512402 RepID=A0A9X7WHF8_9MYCO|nr:hypothetical protein [Mycolicibacter heraklionensis]KLO28330.1 hypothetical protein ABW16_13570 [Mycolicibacter heraklionensis]QZA08336.1 hypothetical protein K3U94_03140 [Mycolicibacter heraklionensis]